MPAPVSFYIKAQFSAANRLESAILMTKAKPKRVYLAKDDRQRALLDIAATVVEQQGWQALSMIAVAEAGNISRQLVYQHFTSVDELMVETMTHLFRDSYEAIRSNIQENPDDLEDLIRNAARQTFDRDPGKVRALWQMLTATYSENPETSRTGTRLRHLISKLWSPVFQELFGLDAKHGQTFAWILNMAFWGANQVVEEGELTREEATELMIWVVQTMRAGHTRKPPGSSRPGKPSHATAKTTNSGKTTRVTKKKQTTTAKASHPKTAARASKPASKPARHRG